MNLSRKLYSEELIKNTVQNLAARVNLHYSDNCELGSLVIVPILDAAFVFAADFIRYLTNDIVSVEFMGISSYDLTAQGKLITTKNIKAYRVKDRDVLILDTIFDSGKTMEYAKKMLSYCEPSTIKTCCLVNKNKHKNADFQGLTYCKEDFLVGYGTDYDGLGRELKSIYVIGGS